MRLVNIYKDIDKSNDHNTRILTDKEYDKERDYLLGRYTIIVYDEEGELIDDNT